ncbi:HEAT repeat domain-containing protein [Acidobacteria bacterium AH-259-O06]|nr:HEAT repeat domain-containing protein [Acidobacteria bacterium AH-259-O06]
MALYFFLAMTCVSMVKSLQIALYLSRVGFDWRLPSLYALLALLSGPIVLLYRSLIRRYSHVRLVSNTLVFFLFTVALFWLLVGKEQSGIYLAFYTWGGVFTLLLPTLGWVISYDLYTTREAKRLFTLLGTGGILGGACGGYYTALVAGTLGASGLLVHVFALLLVLQGVLVAIYQSDSSRLDRRYRPSSESSRRPRQAQVSSVRGLFRSRHLIHLAGIVLVSAFATTLIDLQYQWVLDRRYPGAEAQIAQFVSALLGTMYSFSALFQLFVTRPVLRYFGVGAALLILPLALLGGSGGLVILLGFWAVVTLKAIDGSLRSSVHRTGLEMLYVPIWSPQTVTVKTFIDLVVFRFGDALGAAAFLGVSTFLLTPVKVMGITVAVVAAFWAYLAVKLGTQYIESLRYSLESKATRGLHRSLILEEAGAKKALMDALQSPNPAKVHFALQQLASVSAENEPEVRDFPSQAEEIMHTQISGIYSVRLEWLKAVAPLVDHSDPQVGAAAFHLLVRHHRTKYLPLLEKKLNSEWVPETIYLCYLDRYVKRPGRYLRPPQVLRWCQNLTPGKASILARLMGKTKNPAFLPVLRQWMSGDPGEPARAAIEAIGQYADPRFLDAVINLLGSNSTRQAAGRALISYGETAVSHLLQLLRNPAAGPSIRRQIPLILSRINTSSSRAALVAALYSPDPVVSFSALKGLNKIRASQDLSYFQESFLPLLQIWAKQYYELVNVESILNKKGGDAWRLLGKANRERMDWAIEKIFRGLELFLPHGDAYFAYLGYTSDKKELRENAIELIDTRIKGELRHTLLPIFSEENSLEVARRGRELFRLPSDPDAILLDALLGSDPWFKCCVLVVVREQPKPILERAVRQACQDIDPIVRETAQWVLKGVRP